ncbi:arylamine N-acetyltransferase family protein [Paractinoplanes atraurantiacus]|uniref:Arylamine N-acetyltransferase n=1 Tax=Paractinoplanes atraurantiacus TaxID=1036182 RepID=A0A285KMN3_9ACTN|nr:arylamine N-acetyltransferase [Actinoplanes atraurantiacus]SNY73147.1 Arylamine N-acetyltransferase [Actinoplanes atraurantiacus]
MDVDGYLRRLGLGGKVGRSPSVDELGVLHRAHAERVPYESLEIWLGRPTTLEPGDSVARILKGRGGYCYHLNGAFSMLLRALGYQVSRHVGGVQGNAERPAGADANHLVLTVSGLPSAEAPDGRWLVDLGMGDGLHGPLPLVEGRYRQGPFTYGLSPSKVEAGGWRFEHDPRGGFLGMDFRPEAVEMVAFAEKHHFLSTSPESGFVRTATAQRRDAEGADVLRGLTLSRVGETVSRTEIETRGDYFAALADVFGITLGDVSAAERAVMWRRLVEARAHLTDHHAL